MHKFTKQPTCHEIKSRFDKDINSYVEGIKDILEKKKFEKTPNHLLQSGRDDHSTLIKVIKESRYFKLLRNDLANFFSMTVQKGDALCFEQILEGYYVDVFNPAYRYFMNIYKDNQDNLLTVAEITSGKMLLRLIKDSIYSPFTHFGKRRENLTILKRDLKTLTRFSFGSSSTPRPRSRSRSPQQTPVNRISQVTRSPRQFNTGTSPTTQCVICHDQLDNGQRVITLDCPGYHRFHRDCICGWYRQQRTHTTCPMCRAPVNLNTICGRLSPLKKPLGDITNNVRPVARRIFG